MRHGARRRQAFAAEADRQDEAVVGSQHEAVSSERVGERDGFHVDLAGSDDLALSNEVSVEFVVGPAERLSLAFEQTAAAKHAEMAHHRLAKTGCAKTAAARRTSSSERALSPSGVIESPLWGRNPVNMGIGGTRCNGSLAKAAETDHMTAVDRWTDDLVAPLVGGGADLRP